MSFFSYTLVGDGPTDRALLPIVDWVLKGQTDRPFSQSFISSADVRSHDLETKIARALALYKCDVLFVHRDAERSDHFDRRIEEIVAALPHDCPVHVPVVPIRMTEAWLLLDEVAIRRAANNPNGTAPLHLPRVARLENVQDPKAELLQKLRIASELGARRIRQFDERQARARVAELIADFAPLRVLPAFSAFEEAARAAVVALDAGQDLPEKNGTEVVKMA